MSIFDSLLNVLRGGRRVQAPRNATEGPISASDPRILDLLDVQAEPSGVYVTEASAMSIAAVWACVRVIAGTMSLLPVRLARERWDPEIMGIVQEDTERDELWWLLNEEPHPMWTASSAWSWVTQSMLLRGDGFMEIVRQGDRVKWLKPLHPNRVSVLESDTFGAVYRVQKPDGKYYVLTPPDILHFAGFGFDGLTSPSAIKHYARRAIGIAQATDDFSARFFGHGALTKHAIRAPNKMSETAVSNLRAQWADRYAGLENSYKPIVLTEGLDIKELSLANDDAELIASRQFQVVDIARAFGVPPILIQEHDKTSSWGTGVEQIIIGFVRFTMAPHLKRFRDEINRKLFKKAGRVALFDTDALTQPDSKGFGELLRQLVGGSQGPGILTRNEARSMLRRGPRPEGNKLYEPKKESTDGKADQPDGTDPAGDPADSDALSGGAQPRR